MRTLKRLLGETPKALISAAAEEPLAQVPVPATFSYSADTEGQKREEGRSTKKHKF